MSYNKNFQHIVWRTYRSQPTIPNDKKRILLTYLFKMSEEQPWKIIRMNSCLDHVHLLLEIPVTMSIPDLVQLLKGRTSKVFRHHEHFPQFEGWNKGYGSFSIGFREVETVKNYIINQEEHHLGIDTDTEFRSLLEDNGLEEDEYFDENW